jgi:hypothetical protein
MLDFFMLRLPARMSQPRPRFASRLLLGLWIAATAGQLTPGQGDQWRREVQDFNLSADQCILLVCPAVPSCPAPGEVLHRNLPGSKTAMIWLRATHGIGPAPPRNLSVAFPISLVRV